ITFCRVPFASNSLQRTALSGTTSERSPDPCAIRPPLETNFMSVPARGAKLWLSARMFPPAVVATGLAVAFLACCEAQFAPWLGPRLHVNLALAWVPYLCSLAAVLAAEKRPHSLWPALPGILWFIFFPNAPYLVTDWLYLDSAHDHLWSSIGLLMAFSLCGL